MLRLSSVIAALAAVLIAGCGGSSKPPAASTHPSFTAVTADAYKYSACMRDHGVSNFQDPKVSSGNGEQKISVRVDPSITGSPDFKSAQVACAHLMPGLSQNNQPRPGLSQNNQPSAAAQAAHTRGLLAFAACMRHRGFTRFPDPNSQGQLTLAMIQGAGINLSEPAVKPAADACAGLTHGIITKADVAQAIANPNASGSQSKAAG